MSKQPRHLFKPHSNECPSCLLVLNQLPCYFTQGTEQALATNGYTITNIPRNATHRHRLLDQNVFNDNLLPHALYDHKLIRSLRKNTALLLQPRSSVLSYYEPRDRQIALLRAIRSADSDMPLGLLYSQEKPRLETRLHNAITAFNDKLDRLVPADTSSPHAPPSYDNSATLNLLLTEVHLLKENIQNMPEHSQPNISFNAKTKEIEELVTKLSESFESQITLVRKEQADQHKTTMRYLEAKFAFNDRQLAKLTATGPSRSTTPKPEHRLSQPVAKPTTTLHAALSSAQRPLSPDSLPSHSRSNSLATQMQHLRTASSSTLPVKQPSTDQTQSEHALFDPDSDAESDDSTLTTSTMMTTNTVTSSGSVNASLHANDKDRNVTSCDAANISNWLEFLSRKSHSFQKAPSSKKKASEIAESIYDKYVDLEKASPDFEQKVIEAIADSIRARRPKPNSTRDNKSSRSKGKPN